MIGLWEAALWGAFGGLAIELIELLGALKRVKRVPWRQPGEATLAAFGLSVLIRLVLGVGLAVALARTGQISGAVGALASGVAAPLVLEQLGRQFGATIEQELPAEKKPRRPRGGGVEPHAGGGGISFRGEDRVRGEQLGAPVRRSPGSGRNAGLPAAPAGAAPGAAASGLHGLWRTVVRSTPAFGGRMQPR